MRITWQDTEKRFELHGCAYEEREYPAGAKWKWDGSIWWTMLPAIVLALRGQKPPSGLSITKQAFDRLQPIVEAPVPATKRRKVKKEVVFQGSVMARTIPAGFVAPEIPRFKRPASPGLKCRLCGEPVYFYEMQEPPCCLWCELQEETNGSNRSAA